MNKIHHAIDYIELYGEDLMAMKEFYGTVFGWKFVDFGANYVDFFDGHRHGGFARGPVTSGSTLVLLSSDDLEETKRMVEKSGGKIFVDIFSFPGGRRFQFVDPVGNELGVWTPSG